MYILKSRIQNFRCFDDAEIEFNEGLNVISVRITVEKLQL